MGSWPGKKVLTKASLTMAAPGEVSCGRKSRPETRGIFIVENQPGETLRKKAGVGLGGAPLMEMSLLILMRPRRGQPEMATELTPGAARSASAVWFQTTGSWPLPATVSIRSRRSVEKPRGRFSRRWKDATKSEDIKRTRKQKAT